MSISTTTDLANMALNMIGAGSIANIDDSSKQAVVCKRFLDMAIRKSLSRGEFSGSIKRTQLSLANQWVRQDYQYQYYLPNDYIKALSMDSLEDFEIEGNYLYSNEYTHTVTTYASGTTTTGVTSMPVLIYLAYPTNLNTLQPFVADYIAATLAVMISAELLNDLSKISLAKTNMQEAYIFAKSANLSEKKGKAVRPSQWSDYMNNTVVV